MVDGKRVFMAVPRRAQSENVERCFIHPDTQAAFVGKKQKLFDINKKLCNGCWIRLAQATETREIIPEFMSEPELISFLKNKARRDTLRKTPSQIQLQKHPNL